MSETTPRKTTGAKAAKGDAENSPTGTTTGADSMAAGSDANGAVKSYLGQDAADLQAAKADATEGVQVPAEVTPTTFAGAQPPAGHVADPTSKGHVGSTGQAKGATKTADPRPESAKGTKGTSEENADKAAAGTQTGTTPPAQQGQQGQGGSSS